MAKRPPCPVCLDRGWIEVPDFSEMAITPGVRPEPCPECTESFGSVFGCGLFLLGFLILMVWGLM